MYICTVHCVHREHPDDLLCLRKKKKKKQSLKCVKYSIPQCTALNLTFHLTDELEAISDAISFLTHFFIGKKAFIDN